MKSENDLMRGFLRRCRGVLGLSLTWGGAWAAIFGTLALIAELVRPGSIDPGEGPIVILTIGAAFGFISGAIFGGLLSIGERGKSIASLSLRRAALWGALGTAAWPLLTPVDNGMLFLVCPIGAALAAGSVGLAKKVELTGPPEHQRLAG